MKNVLYVTGTRAEYGILRELLKKLDGDSSINLKIVATAMHLEKKYGETYRIIENDGFIIDKKISMNLTDTSASTILKGMSFLQTELADYFEKNSFDLIIVLGDRYEMLSVVNCAVLMRVPICHLHGGELTLGNYDEFIRHAITKMSHLHLTSTERYRQRVLQLGERPNSVLNVGSLGVANAINNLKQIDKSILSEFHLSEKYGVVLFHPETLGGLDKAEREINTLLASLGKQKMQFVFIGANSDTGSDTIMSRIEDYINKDFYKSFLVLSLPTESYHVLIQYSQFLIGNSSSGIIEVPSLGVPTINLGLRQEGRVHGKSVIDVKITEFEIDEALTKAQSEEFQRLTKESENPYFQENAIENAYHFIQDNLEKGIPLIKEFVDWKPNA